MQVGQLRQYSHLDVLKGIGRNLLVRFLDAFSADLAARNLPLPEKSLRDTEFFNQVATLFSRPEALPPNLAQTLSAISSMTALSAAQASPNTTHTGPGYSLRKGLDVWHLKFHWDLAEFRHERGILYVAHLLFHPPEQPIHGIDLTTRIPELYRKQLGISQIIDPTTGKPSTLESHARIQQRSLALDDAQAMRALLRQERQLEAILDSQDASEPEKEEALRELEEIAEFQRRHGSRTKDSAQNVADTIRTAIWRFQRRLSRATDLDGKPHPVLCPFALHIANYILLPSARHSSGCFTYEPPTGVRWET